MRYFILLVLFFGLVFQSSGLSQPRKDIDFEELKDGSKPDIQSALDYLAERQVIEEIDGKTVGYWLDDVGYKRGGGFTTTAFDVDNVATTSLAGLAFMSQGHYPNRGYYGSIVENALKYILSQVQDNPQQGSVGFISANKSRMYSHAFAVLFLCEIWGQTGDSYTLRREAFAKTKSAVRFIVNTQNINGGWRYSPYQEDSDLSVVVCQLQALRSARMIGINVPETVIAKAEEYIKSCYDGDGKFHYESLENGHSRTSWPLAAIGMVGLQTVGNYTSFNVKDERKSFDPVIQTLWQLHQDDASQFSFPDYDYFYGHYYAAQAFYQYGREKPEEWEKWKTLVNSRFAHFQRENGGWSDAIGSNYATAMAILILSIDKEYLPIFLK